MQKVIIIVGMHRSGTSSLAGMLEEAGLFLGEVVTQAKYNPKGNRENQKFRKLNDQILIANGGRWSKPPRSVVWQTEHRQARDSLVSEFQGVPMWGFKDPRTLLTVDGWLEAIESPNFVGTFRHPFAVGRSLCNRNRGSLGDWLNLWAVYNRVLLKLHDRFGFPMVDFDWPIEVYQRAVDEIAAGLEIPLHARQERPTGKESVGDTMQIPRPTEKQHFFDPALRHWSSDSMEEIPREIERTYLALRERVGHQP